MWLDKYDNLNTRHYISQLEYSSGNLIEIDLFWYKKKVP